jgi:RHS repeat-associated protein
LTVSFFVAVTPTHVDACISSPVFIYYHGDHLGSSNIITDRSGTLVDHYEYFAFGKDRYNPGCSFQPSNKFTGQIKDDDTGLYYYNARYYDPELGRFIQPDTIVPSAGDPQSLNRYSYVRNNPLMYTDPSGHWPHVNFKLDQLMENVGEALKDLGKAVGKFLRGDTVPITFVFIDQSGRVSVRTVDVPVAYLKNVRSSITLPSGTVAFPVVGPGKTDFQSLASESESLGPAGASERFLSAYPTVARALKAFRDWQNEQSLTLHIENPALAEWMDKYGPIITEGMSLAMMTANGGGVQTADQYALVAAKDGYYPVMKGGFAEPQGEVWLNAGDVWKYGKTINPATRYSKTRLDELGLVYERQFSGTPSQALAVEKQKILNYQTEYGTLPPGNKIAR